MTAVDRRKMALTIIVASVSAVLTEHFLKPNVRKKLGL